MKNQTHKRFSGKEFVKDYDKYRPKPPETMADIVLQLIGKKRADVVVDFGSGTGLSTIFWHDKANRIIGVEPNTDMLLQAKVKSKKYKNISYINSFTNKSGLKNNSADIITSAQAIHWMEPKVTTKEITRILKKNGVVIAYNYVLPPICDVDVQIAFKNVLTKADELIKKNKQLLSMDKKWYGKEHMEEWKKSKKFKYIDEISFNSKIIAGKEMLLAMITSQGGINILMNNGFSEKDIGLNKYMELLNKKVGSKKIPIYFTYRALVGVKK